MISTYSSNQLLKELFKEELSVNELTLTENTNGVFKREILKKITDGIVEMSRDIDSLAEVILDAFPKVFKYVDMGISDYHKDLINDNKQPYISKVVVSSFYIGILSKAIEYEYPVIFEQYLKDLIVKTNALEEEIKAILETVGWEDVTGAFSALVLKMVKSDFPTEEMLTNNLNRQQKLLLSSLKTYSNNTGNNPEENVFLINYRKLPYEKRVNIAMSLTKLGYSFTKIKEEIISSTQQINKRLK